MDNLGKIWMALKITLSSVSLLKMCTPKLHRHMQRYGYKNFPHRLSLIAKYGRPKMNSEIYIGVLV